MTTKTLYPGALTETRPNLLQKLAIKPWIPGPPRSITLINVLVVDPASGSLLGTNENELKHTVIMKNGKFAEVRPTNEGDKNLFEEEEVVVLNLNGAYICPGLIDCHVHVTAVAGVKTMGELMRVSAQEVHLRTTYNLKEMLQRGFTTVRDTGGATKVLANAIEEGLIVGPRLFQCGKALSQTGGHGDFAPALSGGHELGCCGGGDVGLFARVADGVPAVLSAVRGELKSGADWAYADLLVLNANPLDDVTVLDRPENHLMAVIKGGRVVVTSGAKELETLEGLKR
ncbi:hypothetical protein HHX47_DHR2000628 [Lentinula edodes]|nr:hypothetical protein HHX47_DHR2000628 [Lentinula edodes]